MKIYYVNMYMYDRAYGGPEEGGWWYDCYTPSTDFKKYCRVFFTKKKAKNYLADMKRLAQAYNKGRIPVDSVMSEGHLVSFIENHPAKERPENRPYYN